MRAYIIRRLSLIIPTLFLVSMLAFFLVHSIPGDIVDAMQSQTMDEPIDRAVIEKALGLDRPLYIQYGRWMGVVPQMDGNFSGVFQGNLGWSYWRRQPVNGLVVKAWPVTLELGLMSLIIANLISLPIGVYSALRQDKWGDYIGRSFAIGCISIPNFWVATLVVILPAIWWGYMLPIMLIPFTENPLGNLRMFIVPAITLGMAMAGNTMRITRTQVLEVLRQDYIRTAWAKGLRERVVIIRHTLKNALIPVVTSIGLQIPVLVGGTVIIENIFCLPGMGRLILDALINRDEPLVCGVVIIFASILLLVNIVVDLTYAFLDPRIRYQ
ncbi:Dipeptide transport system permease protein DppB [subsurface metagenome]